MKLVAALAIALMSSIAMARGEINWEYPIVNGLSLGNACHTEKTFKTLQPITYCTETKVTERYACRQGETEICRPLRDGEQPYSYEYLKEETSCVKYASQHMEVSRTFSYQKCVKWTPFDEINGSSECTQWKTVTEFAGTTYNIIGYDAEGNGQTFQKKFKVPACQ